MVIGNIVSNSFQTSMFVATENRECNSMHTLLTEVAQYMAE